jgi:hypothetical protein
MLIVFFPVRGTGQGLIMNQVKFSGLKNRKSYVNEMLITIEDQ